LPVDSGKDEDEVSKVDEVALSGEEKKEEPLLHFGTHIPVIVRILTSSNCSH
jgi:hypothetical protein